MARKIKKKVFNGKSICVTGTLASMKREQFQERIQEYGGNFCPSVTRNTDILVVGDNPGLTKLKNAAKFDVKIMYEADFLESIIGTIDHNATEGIPIKSNVSMGKDKVKHHNKSVRNIDIR